MSESLRKPVSESAAGRTTERTARPAPGEHAHDAVAEVMGVTDGSLAADLAGKSATRTPVATAAPAALPGVTVAPAGDPTLPSVGASAAARQERRRIRNLFDQLGTILLSLALAVVIWLIAVSQANPLITQEFPERIPITVRGLDPMLQSVQDLSTETVRFSLRASRVAWGDLKANNLSATVDLSSYGVGTYDVPVVESVTDPRVTVLGISPPNLRIQLDPLATKEISVTVQILDAPAFGYDWQTPVVEPPTITVKGPATQVDLVDQIVVPVYLLNAKSQVERTTDVRPINRQNQVVTGIELSTNFAHVVVPVEQWPGRKEVAVRINLVGQPAAGYRLSTVRAEPSTVVLQGVAEQLASVPGYIETEPLSIDGATTELRPRLNLVVPPGVTVFDGSSVQAIVSITPIEGGTTVTVRPIVQGLAPDLDATHSPETVDVILSGPIPLLESLNADDMFVILDLSGLLPGTHVVTPRVVLPDGIRQEGVLPETVEVVITAPPAADAGGETPLPEPTADPASNPEATPAVTRTPIPNGSRPSATSTPTP